MANLMKSLAVMIGMIATPAFLSGCVENDPRSRVAADVSNQNARKFSQASPVSGGFTENEKISRDVLSSGTYIGNTLDGTRYSYGIMSDRRGILASLVNPGTERYERYGYNPLFGDWNLECEENPMTDRMSCSLTYNRRVRLIGSSPTQLSTLCLYDHDFPGRSASIRINRGNVINLGEDGCKRSASLVDDFLSADSVSISFVRWPYDNRVNFSMRDYKSTNVNEFLSFASGIF